MPLAPGILVSAAIPVSDGDCAATHLTVRLTRGGQLVEERRFPGS